MAIRIHCEDAASADEYAATLVAGGFAAEVTQERFAGEGQAKTGRAGGAGDEEVNHIITTDAPTDIVSELLEDTDAFVEVTDPMSGTVAGVSSSDLPDEPVR